MLYMGASRGHWRQGQRSESRRLGWDARESGSLSVTRNTWPTNTCRARSRALWVTGNLSLSSSSDGKRRRVTWFGHIIIMIASTCRYNVPTISINIKTANNIIIRDNRLDIHYIQKRCTSSCSPLPCYHLCCPPFSVPRMQAIGFFRRMTPQIPWLQISQSFVWRTLALLP